MYRDYGEPGPSSGAGSPYGRPAQPPQAQAQTAQQQKFHLVPSIDSSSQELHWMVQPHFLGPTGYPRPLAYPQYSPPQPRPGVIRALGPPPGVRRRPCEQISPEEEERRRVRRERNKLAAAKCRNRRKELTDFLQAVSIIPRPGPTEPQEGSRLPRTQKTQNYSSGLCHPPCLWGSPGKRIRESGLNIV